MALQGSDILRILKYIYPEEVPPRPLSLLLALEEVREGGDISVVAKSHATSVKRLKDLGQQDAAAQLFGGSIPTPSEDRVKRSRNMLGQLVLGRIAEVIFQEIYKETVGTSELRLEDDRTSHTDTDFRVLNGNRRPVFRINIKYHGSTFQKAEENVGLKPENCFALATYKINFALEKQEAEHLPYIFVIVGVPGLTGARVGEMLPSELIQFAAATAESKKISGKRGIEDRIVDALFRDPDRYNFKPKLDEFHGQVCRASWYALSARRAEKLLRELLFKRVYALRVRAFARNYKNAELDMHFSLSDDLTPLDTFLKTLREDGLPGLVSRLERGTY